MSRSQKLWRNAKSIDNSCLPKVGESLLLLVRETLASLDSLKRLCFIHLLPVIPASIMTQSHSTQVTYAHDK